MPPHCPFSPVDGDYLAVSDGVGRPDRGDDRWDAVLPRDDRGMRDRSARVGDDASDQGKITDDDGRVPGQTAMSPGSRTWKSASEWMMRAVPVTRPAEAGVPRSTPSSPSAAAVTLAEGRVAHVGERMPRLERRGGFFGRQVEDVLGHVECASCR